MISRLLVLVLLACCVGIPVAQAGTDGSSCRDGCVPVAAGGQGVIDVTYTKGKSEQVPGRKPVVGTKTWPQVEEAMAPTCPGNSRVDDSTTCTAAISSCP